MQGKYKLLLVDDEDEIRGRIASLISDESGFVVVGKAGNGHDAYELVEELKPDVVLTDIKMPFIDGIELAKMLKRDYPTIKVAFISGYDEFKYAQEAINLNVISYLMKPLSSNDINLFLNQLKHQLDDEYQKKFNIDEAMKHYREGLPLMMNHAIVNLIMNHNQSHLEIEKLKSYGMDVSSGVFISCLFEIEDVLNTKLNALERFRLLLDQVLTKNMLDYTLRHHLLIQNRVFLILRSNGKTNLKDIDAFLYEILQNVEQFMDLRIRVGVSSFFDEIDQIHVAYEESMKANEYGKFLNTGRIVYIGEIEHKEKKHFQLEPNEIKKIETTLKFGSIDEIKIILDDIKSQIKDLDNVILTHDLLIISLANIIMNFATSIPADTSDLIEDRILLKMLSYTDINDLFDWILELLMQLRNRLIDSNMSRVDEILHKAMLYVDQHYHDPNLSLNTVCDYLDISISYLSMLMKKSNSMSFNKYVVFVRMEKAKELLVNQNCKIIDISMMCGYNDVYYFSHSFKKYTGVSPKQYREKNHV